MVPSFALEGSLARPVRRPGPSLARPKRAFLGETFDGMLGIPSWLGDIIRLLIHGATAYLGIYAGLLSAGFVSVLGWIAGIASAVGAACDLASLAGRAFCG